VKNQTTPADAMPVVSDATSDQSYPFGPEFAAYRLPFPAANAMIGSRAAGVCLEGEPSGGANPPAGDPPPTPTPTPPTEPPPPPATGDPEMATDAGKRALDAERTRAKAAEDRAKAAEKERDELKLATASDTDKAIAKAKKEGADEVIGRVHATVRRAAVREALATAGAMPSLIADLARADEFAALKVSDEDEVDAKELADAVKAHKARVPDAYRAAAAAGSADGGSRSGGGKEPAKDLTSALERHYAPSQG
jgi:hypothetical protein